jgi:hypothetical protein
LDEVSFRVIPGPDWVSDTDDLTLADRPEISAVERIWMRLHYEKLSREQREAPFPDWERTLVLVSLEGLGFGLAVDENDGAETADSVADDSNNPLEKWDARRQNGVPDEQGLECFPRSDDDEVAAGGKAKLNAIPPDGSTSGGVVDEPRQG